MNRHDLIIPATLSLAALLGFGADTSVLIDLDSCADPYALTVSPGDTCTLAISGATSTKTINKTGNGSVSMANLNFTLKTWDWKGAGVFTADNCIITCTDKFQSYGNWNEQTNIFNNCTLTAGTFHNDCNRNRLHYGYTFFNGGTYTFNKFYVTGSDSGSGSGVFIRNGAAVTVNTELYCVRLTSGDPGVARLVIEDGTLSTPQINLGWANATLKQGAVELLGGTLTTKTIVNGPGNADYVLGNGGAFVPTTAGTDILPAAIEHVYIGADGLTINTTVDTTISKSFEPWTDGDGNTVGGPLVKRGSGLLTLTGAASTHAETVVESGTLKLGAEVTSHPAVRVKPGAVLDLSSLAAGTTLAGLSIGDATGAATLTLVAGRTLLLSTSAFNPANAVLDIPNLSGAAATYDLLKMPGEATQAQKDAWAACQVARVEAGAVVLVATYDSGNDETTFSLAASIPPSEREGEIDLSAGDVMIEVVPGETFTATSVIGGNHSLTVSGNGTFILPEDDYSSAWNALVIDGVTYNAKDGTSLGSGPVLIKNGGRINFSDPFTLNNVITVESGSTGSIYFPEGKTTVKAGKLVTAGATFYKLGPGNLYSDGNINTAAVVGNSRWICEEGDITVYGEKWGVAGFYIEMHEGTVLHRSSNVYHLGIGNVVLRGAQFLYELPHNSVNNNVLHMSTTHFAAGSFALSVLASTNGAPSYASVDNPFSTYFTFNVDVEENATLYLNSNLRGNGPENLVSLKKTGLGKLCLMKSPYEHTSITVDEGTLALSGRNARIGKNVALVLGEDAKIELENGAVLDNVGVAVSPLVAEAEVHLDATLLAKEFAHDTFRPSVANLGSTGGVFQRYSASGAPNFSTNSINGRPAFWCKTASSTGLGAAGVIPNTGSELSIYFVANPQLSLFTFADANHGKNASPICFTTDGANDQPTKQGGFCYKYEAENKFSIYFQGNDAVPLTIEDDAVALSKGPFIDCVRRDATSARFLRWYSDSDEYSVALDGQAFANFNFANCAIMAWMKGPGNIWQNITCPMDIGEVLVFTRKLTDDEDMAIRGYLARKWFDSSFAWPELPATGIAKTVTVSVAEGENGVLSLDAAEGDRQVQIVKEGAGNLVNVSCISNQSEVVVSEGTLSFEALDAGSVSPAAIWFDAADASTVTMDGTFVAEVKNKGWAGGVFTPMATSVNGTPTLGQINGVQAVQFDGIDDFLRTTAFTNSAPRQLYVYMVNQRDSYRSAAGYFSFTQIESGLNDDKQTGAIMAYDKDASQHLIDAGTVDVSYGTFDNSIPVIDYYYIGDYTVSFGQMNAASTYDAAVQQRNMHAKIPADDDRATLNDLFQIGARKNGSDVPKWFWEGKIGEVVVFEQPLNIDQLTELLDYFRAKWMGLPGSSVPPAWLVGHSRSDNTNLKLTQLSGTTVAQNGPEVTLGSYTAEEGACLARDVAFDFSDQLFFIDGDVDFDGAITLDFTEHAMANQPLMSYSGAGSVRTPLWTGNNGGYPAKGGHNSATKKIFVPGSGLMFLVR